MTNEKSLYKTTRIVWYVFYVIETLLVFRFVLKLFAANSAAGFTSLIYGTTSIFLQPFKFVFGNDSLGNNIFEWSTLLAIFVYWVLFWGIIKIIVMNRRVDESEAEKGLELQDNTQIK